MTAVPGEPLHLRRAARLAPIGIAAATGIAAFLLRPPLPEDWDSIGFVRSLDAFDLDQFQPHFPGYPVFVALGRAMHTLVPSPLAAACLVSAIAIVVSSLALARIASRLATDAERAAVVVAALFAVAALPLRAGGAPQTESLALAFATVAFAALVEDRPLAGGLALGLMLGVRASWFPLALSWFALAVASARRRATRRAVVAPVAGFVIGVVAWLLPFVLLVGPRHLARLGATHLRGHFTLWGGAVSTRPGLLPRSVALLRDLLFDGIAPSPWPLALLVATAIAAIVLARAAATATAMPAGAARVATRRVAVIAAVVAAPYAVWILLGQNVIEQPRHALPLVALVILLVAPLLARVPALAVAAVLATASASLPLLLLRATSLPPAAQAAAWVAAHPAPTAAPVEGHPTAQPDVIVWGGRSIRFFQLVAPSVATRTRSWLSEVDVDLARVDHFPHNAIVTSELDVERGDHVRRARLRPGPGFCWDARLDRRESCLRLSLYQLLPSIPPSLPWPDEP